MNGNTRTDHTTPEGFYGSTLIKKFEKNNSRRTAVPAAGMVLVWYLILLVWYQVLTDDW